MWEYRAQLKEVVDGDTVDLRVDLGFKTYKTIRVRLPAVDTAEIYGVEDTSETYELGMEQKEFVKNYLDRDGEWPLRFISDGETGKYGRWIGHVKPADELSVSTQLIIEFDEVGE